MRDIIFTDNKNIHSENNRKSNCARKRVEQKCGDSNTLLAGILHENINFLLENVIPS